MRFNSERNISTRSLIFIVIGGLLVYGVYVTRSGSTVQQFSLTLPSPSDTYHLIDSDSVITSVTPSKTERKNNLYKKSDDNSDYQSELSKSSRKTDKPSDVIHPPNLDNSLPQSTNRTDSTNNLRDSPRTISDDHSDSEAGMKPDKQTIISVLGRPMEEPVTKVSYADNVYFTIKTTETNYKSRLSLLMMTWLELVKHKVCESVVEEFSVLHIVFQLI